MDSVRADWQHLNHVTFPQALWLASVTRAKPGLPPPAVPNPFKTCGRMRALAWHFGVPGASTNIE